MVEPTPMRRRPSPSISAVRIRIAESSVRPPWPSPPISAATPL
ncbi:Uncharacterised protein [Pseudomonas aeruginosa]|nr:Uncharacterised protein [Pseudomonas aeruginosa]